VHEWRVTHDAILVGAQTVIADDPRLNVRLVQGRNPHVIIVDGKLRTPPGARALQGLNGRRVFLCTSDLVTRRKQGKVRRMMESGVQVLSFPADRTRISLKQVVRRLYRYDIGTILVEGGADIASGFLYGGLVDRLSIFVSPRMMGSGLPGFGNAEQKINRSAQPSKNFTVQRSGNDLLLQYDFE
jgi:riboflavin-specific deaminase-like protein